MDKNIINYLDENSDLKSNDEKDDLVSENEADTVEQKPKKRKHRIKTFFKEFTDFLKQGNIVDLAVAFVVGAAFRAVISSLVSDILMPLIASLGGKSVADLALTLNYAADGTPNMLYYGNFLQSIIDFIIIALAIFVALKTLTNMREFMEKSGKVVKEKLEIIKKNEEIDALKKDIAELKNNNSINNKIIKK